MGEAKKNKFFSKVADVDDLIVNTTATITTMTVSSNITFSLSTSSTSFNFVASIDTLSTLSTQLNFSKRTAYIESGIIRSMTTAASTFVLST